MAENNVAGPLTNIHNAPLAVEEHLQEWMNTYMNIYERDNGLDLGTYPRPFSWLRVNLLEGVPGEDSSPAVIIVTRGDTAAPEQDAKGWSLPLDIGVALVTTSFETDGARDAAGVLGVAALKALLDKRNLGGRMNGKLRVESWDGIRLDDLPGEEQRTRAILRLEFTVRINDVIWRTGGPLVPDPETSPDPPGTWPPVEEHIETVRKEDHT